jgi:hypothetical protein
VDFGNGVAVGGIEAVAVGVGVGRGVGVAVGRGVEVGLGAGFGAGVNFGVGIAVGSIGGVPTGVGLGVGVAVGKAVGDSITGLATGSAARGDCSLGKGVGLRLADSPGSNHPLTISPFAKLACNRVVPWTLITGPSNFPFTILPV